MVPQGSQMRPQRVREDKGTAYKYSNKKNIKMKIKTQYQSVKNLFACFLQNEEWTLKLYCIDWECGGTYDTHFSKTILDVVKISQKPFTYAFDPDQPNKASPNYFGL